MISRNVEPIKMRNYGRIIQDMIRVAQTEPDRAARERLTVYIAQCMRQRNMVWNKDQEIGAQRIKDDIRTLSNGGLSTDFPGFDEAIQQRKADFNVRPDRKNHEAKPAQKPAQQQPSQQQPVAKPAQPEKPAAQQHAQEKPAAEKPAVAPAPKKRGRPSGRKNARHE